MVPVGAGAGIAAAGALGQDKIKDKMSRIDSKGRDFCSNNNWSSDNKVSIAQVREATVAAGGTLTVDGRQNGGISVKGSDRSDILIRALEASGSEREAKLARAILGKSEAPAEPTAAETPAASAAQPRPAPGATPPADSH